MAKSYNNRRYLNPLEILTKHGHNQNIMNYFGINLKLWMDKSPIENYRNSRGI